ncbi:MAG: hypothetical protein JW915_10280 [Chitinispirillaceae bacterium]|nr:hypothetical protein [Chitinispirillaceae bacterium]
MLEQSHNLYYSTLPLGIPLIMISGLQMMQSGLLTQEWLWCSSNSVPAKEFFNNTTFQI